MLGSKQDLYALLFTVAMAQESTETAPIRISPIVVGAGSVPGSCPSSSTLLSARRNISAAIQQLLPSISTPCGGQGWRPVVTLDMGDPSEQCPSPWIEASSPARSCYANLRDNCAGLRFPTPGVYSRVCGRGVGYTGYFPDAFYNGYGQNDGGINDAYLDGMSITYGSPHQHIWSFGNGHSSRCPCESTDRLAAPLPPSFVGNNYFCDGANGALWDGLDCTDACCTFNSPPWFDVTLPTPTSDDIMVRLCSDEQTNESPRIQLLELYIQ